MDHNKKRVSFSHISIPSQLRRISSSSSDLSDSTNTNQGQSNFEIKQPPPSFKTVETLRIPLGEVGYSGEARNELSQRHHQPQLHSPTANVTELKFLETRRRSHAFSVSAIDETLPVNMADELYDYEKRELDGECECGGVSTTGASIRKRSSSLNGEKKYWRAAEIPIGATNRILLCQTTNSIIQAKSFQHEVRAIKDLDWFVAGPNILLDCDCNSSQAVIDEMLGLLRLALTDTVLSEVRTKLYAANDSTFQLCNVIQNVYRTEDGRYLHDPTWLCTYASIGSLQTRRVVIARLKRPTNFGPTLRAVQFVILVIAPNNEKSLKSAFEISRTFSTLFSESTFRIALMTAADEDRFCSILEQRVLNAKSYNNIFRQNLPREFAAAVTVTKTRPNGLDHENEGSGNNQSDDEPKFKFSIGKGLIENFSRRIKYYPSDFVDGFVGEKTWLKVSAATLSLFFACILPCVAFGMVVSQSTDNAIGPKEALLGQAIGGLVFAFLAGQPLVLIGTTAPLCLFTEVVHQIAQNLNVKFFDLFATVGMWNTFFLLLYAVFDLSQLMNYCTRSTEEIFATFIFIAFTVDAINQCADNFQRHYCYRDMLTTENATNYAICDYSPDKSLLFLFLMFGTVILALLLYNFGSTSYLSSNLREILADYALPLAVVIFSLIGKTAFKDVEADCLEVSPEYRWHIATFSSLTVSSIFLSMILGFALSTLFFIDHNVSGALVSAPSNMLRKGDGYHLDLLVVALLNAGLSLFGLPWMHGILPHSPMHARALADVAQVVDSYDTSAARKYVVLHVRETRVTGVLIHVLIALAVTLGSELLRHIPVAVLSGLFLYCAANTLFDNSLFQRLTLIFTEQRSYPPNHYLRYCPQHIVHRFTVAQILQLAVISFFGFAPSVYVQLIFPIIIVLLIPIRFFVLPFICDDKYLKIIDSKHA